MMRHSLTFFLMAVLLTVMAKKKAVKMPAVTITEAPASSSVPVSKVAHSTLKDSSIQDVDEDRIDEIVNQGTKHLLIFFYDGRSQCPKCSEALVQLEKIDDDLEATGYIEVIKTNDRNIARELGIATYPSMVYFRRKKPLLYDDDMTDSGQILKWVRYHDEVATVDLDDDNFEDRTDSYSPDEGALDWFVMFYESTELDCNSYVATWEAVAHKLRGIVYVGKVDTSRSDDVAERFRIEEDCPTWILFHRGKMYRYKEAAKDVKSFTMFALHKFKEQRGHRIPDPPTALEEFFEEIKEEFLHFINDHQAVAIVGSAGILIIIFVTLALMTLKTRLEQPKAKMS